MVHSLKLSQKSIGFQSTYSIKRFHYICINHNNNNLKTCQHCTNLSSQHIATVQWLPESMYIGQYTYYIQTIGLINTWSYRIVWLTYLSDVYSILNQYLSIYSSLLNLSNCA